VTDYAVSIKACIFELQESREFLPEQFNQLYQLHCHDNQIDSNTTNQKILWKCFLDICESLKYLKKYYDQAVLLIQQDHLMQPVSEEAIEHLEKHYGRNSVHKITYHSLDRNTVKLAICKLIDDVKSWNLRLVASRRSIVYTFFDLAEDSADGFAGRTEEHYFLSRESDYTPSYFYHRWQQDRRTQLFRKAVQDNDLRDLVLQYVRLIDERNMNLGSESDLRYYSDQTQIFEAPYIALLEYSDEYIIDFIDSYSLTYRWYNHLAEVDLVERMLNLHPESPYLRYFYPATGHRMSGNESYCPPFSDWYIAQLVDPKFIEEQLLICATDIIRAQQVCYTTKSFTTIKDIQCDEYFLHSLQECIDSFKKPDDQRGELTEDDLQYGYHHEFYDRLALALIDEELTINNAPSFFSKRHELRLRVANNLQGIIEGHIEPAFDVCYGYQSSGELREYEEKARVTEPLFSLHNVDSFAYIKYQDIPYLISASDNEVTVTRADTMTPVSFRSISDDGLYGVAYALKPEVKSPVHFATLDYKLGLLQGWHLGQSLPVITLRLNAFQNSLPFELSADGRTLLIGITEQVDEEISLNSDLFDIRLKGKDVVVAIDLSTGQERCRFENIPSQTLKLSPNGEFAICSQVIDLDNSDRFVYIDLSTGAEKTIRLPYRYETGSNEFAISFDGQRLVYKQSIIELDSGTCIAEFPGDDYAYQYEFSQFDEYVICTISEDNVRDIYRVSTGEKVARIYGSDGPIFSQNYLDADEGILYSFDDYDISLYDLGSELALNRPALDIPEYHACKVWDTAIPPNVVCRKGSFSNDEHGTKLELHRYGVEGDQGTLVQPIWFKQGESLPRVGVDFTMHAKGIRTVQGFIVNLHHPNVDGKTQSQWQVIGKNGCELAIRDPFTKNQRVEGLYEFEIYSLDQKLMFARQMVYVGFAKAQTCRVEVNAFGSFFGVYHPADKKAAINYDDTTIGYHLLVNCNDKSKSVKLKSRIYREHGIDNIHDDRLFKSFEVQREQSVVDGQLVELVIFGKEHNGYLEGKWRFEMLDAYTNEVLFSDTLTVYMQDHHMTENHILKLDLVDYGIYNPGKSFNYGDRRVKEVEYATLLEQTFDLPKKTELMYGYKFRLNESSPDAVYRICIEQWASGQEWIGADDGNDRYKTHWSTIHRGQLKMASWTIAAKHEIFHHQSRILVRHGSSAVSMMHDFSAKQEVLA